MGVLLAPLFATWALGRSVTVQTHWSVPEEAIATTLGEIGEVNIDSYLGGPTRIQSTCHAHFAEASAAAEAVARASDDLEMCGRKCRVALRRLASREDRKLRPRGMTSSTESSSGSWAARRRQLITALDAAADARGPRALPPSVVPSRGAILTALEALEDFGSLDDSEVFPLAVAALARVGETRRALALYAQLETRGLDATPAARGAAVYALCAANQSLAALDVLSKADGDVDLRGYNAAIAAAEHLGDFDLAFDLLQRRAKRTKQADATRTFQENALVAKRKWLDMTTSSSSSSSGSSAAQHRRENPPRAVSADGTAENRPEK